MTSRISMLGIEVAVRERIADVVNQPIGLQVPHGDVDRDAGPVSSLVPRPGLPAGLVEHPPADLDDEATLLEHRDEDVGRDRPLRGVLPSEQCLDALDLHPVEIEDRVVEQEELAPFEGGLQSRT